MNKEKLINEINKTKEHLANMEKMLAECEFERWRPEPSDVYYYVNSYGRAVSGTWMDAPVDIERYKNYNCFQTIDQALFESEKISVRRMLEDIARRLNKGEKIVWNATFQDKYFIYWDTENDELVYGESVWSKEQGTVYCLDQDFLDIAIQEIGEARLKKYLKGE